MADESNPAVEKLKTVLGEAYDKYTKSCSHSVWYAITKIFDESFEYIQANEMITFISQSSSKWRPVGALKGMDLANEGKIVVGGLKETDHGHVIAIYPVSQIPRGGYSYTKDGKVVKVRKVGQYPRCMSTLIGGWPGAKSNGDKSVWDPWGNDTKYGRVVFWSPL